MMKSEFVYNKEWDYFDKLEKIRGALIGLLSKEQGLIVIDNFIKEQRLLAIKDAAFYQGPQMYNSWGSKDDFLFYDKNKKFIITLWLDTNAGEDKALFTARPDLQKLNPFESVEDAKV